MERDNNLYERGTKKSTMLLKRGENSKREGYAKIVIYCYREVTNSITKKYLQMRIILTEREKVR